MPNSLRNETQNARFYKVKNPRKNFLCALCRAPRQMKYSKSLSAKNYIQLLIIAASLGYCAFSLFSLSTGLKSIFAIALIWPIAEMANKILYRKEIPCPYCGFDATWYRRDVRVARQKVETFWSENYPELVNKGAEMADAVSSSKAVSASNQAQNAGSLEEGVSETLN